MSSALLTDRYELTMIDAALRDGTAHRRCSFEVFARRLPAGRRYGVVAGTGRLVDLIQDFRFGPDELAFLRREKVVAPDTLDWLEAYRFRGDVRGYREGEAYFPGSPVLTIDGTFAEAVILETLALSVLNVDSAVASAAARMVSAAGGRPIAEMGSRRAGERSAVAAARAAYLAGFSATSNLQAGMQWGIPTMGTAAHAFTLLHATEEEAFRSQLDAMGVGTTLLVDTYDIRDGVEAAVRAAGPKLGSVRIDSGDLGVVVQQVRDQLDSLGATGTKIVVTNDLDEFAIAALRSAPVDSYGVGTSVVTGSGAPTSSMVFKLVAHQDDAGAWIPVGKTSEGKATVAGRKRAYRELQDGVARVEAIDVIDDGEVPETGRALQVVYIAGGTPDPQYLGPAGVAAARAHCARAIAELPPEALSLSRGDPAIPTEYR